MKKRSLCWFALAIGLMSLLFCQGCLAAAVAYGAHEYSKSKTESAEKAQRSSDLATYTKYRTEMERINFDRERSGLKPRPIMTQEEWISAQTAGRPAIAPSPSPTPPTPQEERKTTSQ
jgi:hypothetical protein